MIIMWNDVFFYLARRRVMKRAIQEGIEEQQRLREEYLERREFREEAWDSEHEETIYRAYPMISEHYGSIGPLFVKWIRRLLLSVPGILLCVLGISAHKYGWETTIEDISSFLATTEWYHIAAGALFVIVMGSLLFIPKILTGYMENTETIFTDKCVYVRRYLRKDRIVSYEELARLIKKRKICIKNGRYLVPCIGRDISVSMIYGEFPYELFAVLERKCGIKLPEEDLKERARRSGLGWALGRLSAGILFVFIVVITIIVYLAEGEFEWTRLVFDFYINALTWLMIIFVGLGLVANLFFLSSAAFAYRAWNKVIRISLMPILVDVLIFGLLVGGYFASKDIMDKYLPAKEVQTEAEILPEMDKRFMYFFGRGVWGKELEEITAEEFAQIKYISIDYGGAGNTIVRYSMADYKDCANEQEFQESIRTWQCGPDDILPTPADITMLTGLTYVNVPEYSHLKDSMLPADNRITRIEMQDSPDALEGAVDPENLEVLRIDCHEAGAWFGHLEKYPNLKELVYINTASDGEVNLNQLTCIESLERLQLSCGERYINLDVLKDADHLRSLSIGRATLRQCRFLGEMKGLEELELCYGEDGDLTILSDLPKLRRLWLLDCTEVDSSQLTSLSAVEELKVTVNSDDSRNVMEQLTELERLRTLDITFEIDGLQSYLGDMKDGFDLSEFTQITGLQELRVGFGGFASAYGIEAIAGMNRLETFALEGEMATDVWLDKTNLPENHKLKNLCLYKCEVKDCETKEPAAADFLTALQGMENLSLLTFSIDGIESFDFLNSFENLETLTVDEFDLTDSQRQELKEWEEKIEVRYQ